MQNSHHFLQYHRSTRWRVARPGYQRAQTGQEIRARLAMRRCRRGQ